MVLEKTLESSLDKEIKLVHPKGNQPWIFIGRTDVQAKTPILWPPDVKNWLIGKESDAGKDRGQEEKGTTEDEMARWHHRFDGHEFEQAPGDDEGQGSLACCSPWGCKRVRHDWATEYTNNPLIPSRGLPSSTAWQAPERPVSYILIMEPKTSTTRLTLLLSY